MSLTGEAAAPEGYVYQTVYPHAEPPKPPLFQGKTARGRGIAGQRLL